MRSKRVRGTLAAAASVALWAGAGVSGVFAAPTPPPTPEPAPTATVSQQPTAAPTEEELQKITWTRCGAGLQCGTLTVPLDYKDASKGTIELSVARRPADNQKKKLGVLFTNPGGPGGSAVMSVPLFADVVGRQVRSQFDIVGVDPRGVGGSELAMCETQIKVSELENVFSPLAYPITEAQIATHLAADQLLRKACEESKPKILPYLTTADVARDMDRVREALGQKQLNYYGVSYGSYLGVTYAAMFPDKVRTMVVDGVLDPVAWATGNNPNHAARVPVTTRLKSGEGGHRALFAAIDECERAGTDCAEGDDIRNDWAELTERLKKAPVELRPLADEPDFVIEFTYQDLIAMSNGALYDGEVIPDLFQMVHLMNTDMDAVFGAGMVGATPAAAKRQMSQVEVSRGTIRAYNKVKRKLAVLEKERIGYNPPEAPNPEDEVIDFPLDATFPGVLCSETANPTTTDAWVKAAKVADRQAPGFAPLWTWASSVCSDWPWQGVNAYTGPFTSTPAGGMLVMSTVHDPATPYHGAKKVRSLVKNSRLVTVPWWGHAALDVSACATATRTDYLVSGKLPAKDTTCRPDHPLFTTLD